MLLSRSAPGTVAEQRARLPPPADCEDSVEGVWRSHKFSPRHHDWHVQTLYIRRVKGSETDLQGKITAEVWYGGREQEQPGPCRGLTHYQVTMGAKGTVVDGEIRFWGETLKLDRVMCGRYRGYNKDHFSGKIDFDIQEFQSVNNDGGRAVNDPTVFRRIRCWDSAEQEGPPPQINVTPPAFYPERRTGGCSCSLPGRP